MSAADDQNAAITTPIAATTAEYSPLMQGALLDGVGGLLSVHWSQTTPPPPPRPWPQPSPPPLPRPPLLGKMIVALQPHKQYQNSQ
eukprot:scaffold4402_cov324-Alexandrium_tamarense.AAC.3